MAIKRVEWRCPGCGKRYAIPADLPKPDLCPNCRQAAEEETPADDSAAQEGMRADDAPAAGEAPSPGGGPSEPPSAEYSGVPEPSVAYGASGSYRSHRRKFADLRILALILKGFALLSVLAAVVSILAALVSALSMEAGIARSAEIFFRLGVFGGSLFGALLLWLLGGVVQVLLEIEHNTRNR